MGKHEHETQTAELGERVIHLSDTEVARDADDLVTRWVGERYAREHPDDPAPPQ